MAMVRVQFGGLQGRTVELETNEDLVAVRTRDKGPVAEATLSGKARRLLDRLEPVVQFPNAGVEVFHVRSGKSGDRDAVRSTFKAERAIRFAGRVLADPVFKPRKGRAASQPGAATTKEPVLYSENVFVKFAATISARAARRALAARNLKVKREIDYVANGYFVQAPEGIGLPVFQLSLDLLRTEPAVQLCHPELLRKRELRGAFPQQWHLKATRIGGASVNAHASVSAAWRKSKGRGITIAVIDTGIDIDHEEFRTAGKIKSPHDATDGARDRNNPRPRVQEDENHGTCCAGVACGNGRRGASGVAPLAALMPIRLMDALGSQTEADAIAFAADQGADVISCSWGPDDGDWSDPADPAHRAVGYLADNTRLAIEHALQTGRGGKGCVICWAAGNGNESVDNDEYASHPGVIAVAACNDTGTRSVYSDTGKALWCAFPSDDSDLDAVMTLPRPRPQGGVWDVDHPAPKTPGIWTTDWSGQSGYNRGGRNAPGDTAGNYANDFGGTSSAAPGVAGVAALVLARNPGLTALQVKDILKRACDRIDPAHGRYDANGHSALYGYGRVNAAKAVTITPARGPRRRPAKAAKRPVKRAGQRTTKGRRSR